MIIIPSQDSAHLKHHITIEEVWRRIKAHIPMIVYYPILDCQVNVYYYFNLI